MRFSSNSWNSFYVIGYTFSSFRPCPGRLSIRTSASSLFIADLSRLKWDVELLTNMKNVCLTKGSVAFTQSKGCRLSLKRDINFCPAIEIFLFTSIELLNVFSSPQWLGKSGKRLADTLKLEFLKNSKLNLYTMKLRISKYYDRSNSKVILGIFQM